VTSAHLVTFQEAAVPPFATDTEVSVEELGAREVPTVGAISVIPSHNQRFFVGPQDGWLHHGI
jgi:hypothetical protein